MLSTLNTKILRFGKGLLGRIKYGFRYHYSQYDALDLIEQKQEALQKRIRQHAYKKH